MQRDGNAPELQALDYVGTYRFDHNGFFAGPYGPLPPDIATRWLDKTFRTATISAIPLLVAHQTNAQQGVVPARPRQEHASATPPIVVFDAHGVWSTPGASGFYTALPGAEAWYVDLAALRSHVQSGGREGVLAVCSMGGCGGVECRSLEAAKALHALVGAVQKEVAAGAQPPCRVGVLALQHPLYKRTFLVPLSLEHWNTHGTLAHGVQCVEELVSTTGYHVPPFFDVDMKLPAPADPVEFLRFFLDLCDALRAAIVDAVREMPRDGGEGDCDRDDMEIPPPLLHSGTRFIDGEHQIKLSLHAICRPRSRSTGVPYLLASTASDGRLLCTRVQALLRERGHQMLAESLDSEVYVESHFLRSIGSLKADAATLADFSTPIYHGRPRNEAARREHMADPQHWVSAQSGDSEQARLLGGGGGGEGSSSVGDAKLTTSPHGDWVSYLKEYALVCMQRTDPRARLHSATTLADGRVLLKFKDAHTCPHTGAVHKSNTTFLVVPAGFDNIANPPIMKGCFDPQCRPKGVVPVPPLE